MISVHSAFISNNRFQMNANPQAEGEAGEILQCQLPKYFTNKIIRQKVEKISAVNILKFIFSIHRKTR